MYSFSRALPLPPAALVVWFVVVAVVVAVMYRRVRHTHPELPA